MFEADNDPDYNFSPYPDPEHTPSQDKIDTAMYHTMSASATSPRVDWPSSYMPSRSVAAGDDAYDDFLALRSYAAVPVDAPDIRARGRNFPPLGWNGELSPVPASGRVSGTFNIGGVAHKFFRADGPGGVDPDFADDPPIAWETWTAGRYWAIAFTGLPDPPAST